MAYTFDENIVSDLHKDAFGFRPSQSWWYGWTHASDEGKQHEWDYMFKILDNTMAEDARREQDAIVAFEVLVTKTINSGAKTREVALRWIMEASTCDGDWEYLCYTHGLPYSYFRKVA